MPLATNTLMFITGAVSNIKTYPIPPPSIEPLTGPSSEQLTGSSQAAQLHVDLYAQSLHPRLGVVTVP